MDEVIIIWLPYPERDQSGDHFNTVRDVLSRDLAALEVARSAPHRSWGFKILRDLKPISRLRNSVRCYTEARGLRLCEILHRSRGFETLRDATPILWLRDFARFYDKTPQCFTISGYLGRKTPVRCPTYCKTRWYEHLDTQSGGSEAYRDHTTGIPIEQWSVSIMLL